MRRFPALLLAVAVSTAARAQSGAVIAAGSAAAASSKTSMDAINDRASSTMSIADADRALSEIRSKCQLAPNEGKLYAVCDNTSAAARLKGSASYQPQTAEEWRSFATYIHRADRTINGKGRAIVLMNVDKVVAEVSSAGIVTTK